MTCSGEGLANVKIKWLQGFASSRITEQILIMTLWKAAMGIHSHSRSSIPIHTFIPTPIAVILSLSLPFPWESHVTHGIPIVPIPMHISTTGCFRKK